MELIAVYVNDDVHAADVLRPLLVEGAAPATWVLVACTPRLTRHIGRLSSRRNRELWRQQWANDLHARLEASLQPGLPAGTRLERFTAQHPLPEVARRLRQRYGSALRELDARHPRLGATLEPLQALSSGVPGRPSMAAPMAAVSTLSAVLALAD